MIFEPILFALTGTQVVFKDLEGNAVYKALGCLVGAIILRLITTVLVSVGSRFNLKEKIFIALACMAKASVQAALAPVTLEQVSKQPNPDSTMKDQAENVMMICIMSILLTAPSGAMLIFFSGPKLLTKTRPPAVMSHEEWKVRRPSIRDISIIDEIPETEGSSPTTAETIVNNANLTQHNNLMNHNQSFNNNHL